jgi:hypothetical protein
MVGVAALAVGGTEASGGPCSLARGLVLQIFGQCGRGHAVNANTSALAASMSVPILGLTNRESNHSSKHPSELSQDGPLLGFTSSPGQK